MKRIICALLACTFGIVSATALPGCGCNGSNTKNQESKQSYEVVATQPDLKDDTYGFYIINGNELMITRYYGTQTNLVIPDTYKNYTVTTIGHSVFNFNGKQDDPSVKLESVVVPDSVTDIQDYAFAGQKALKSVKLPANLKHLGTNVFFYCMGLETIELPASIESIEPFAFSASGLKSIAIPESRTLTSLPEFMFSQCPDLKEVTIPATVTEIAKNAFEECPADMVIKGASGSYAETYAAEHNISFVTIA